LIKSILTYSIVLIAFISNGVRTFQVDNYSFLEKVTYKEFPTSDSTNFDNYEYNDTLSSQQKRLLKLDEIYAPNCFDFITASANYRLRLSDKFNTVIITYSPSELILTTVIANFDTAYNLIDFKVIALDEIFDNWSRIISEIKDDKLYVTSIDYSTGNSIIKTRIYSFDSNGKINASH
jgi:hypothetical protein